MKKLIGLGVSAAILAVVYWQIDPQRLVSALSALDFRWFLAGLGLMLVLIAATAHRLVLLAGSMTSLSFPAALKATLVGNALNLVLPAKMGDVAKAYSLKDATDLSLSAAVSLSLFEKLLDLIALVAFGCLVLWSMQLPQVPQQGLLKGLVTALLVLLVLPMSPPIGRSLDRLAGTLLPLRLSEKVSTLLDTWRACLTTTLTSIRQGTIIILYSAAIWAVHLVQVWLLLRAVAPEAALGPVFALVPLAILFGLIPFTAAGIGTRDAALVVLLGPVVGPGVAAALGALFLFRYLVPGALGLPFISGYMEVLRRTHGGRKDVEKGSRNSSDGA